MNTMAFFVVSADVELEDQPEWISEYRKKYDEPYALHITLKQHTVLERGTRRELTQVLRGLLQGIQPIPVDFSSLRLAHTDRGGCVMLDAPDANELIQIQSFMRRLLEHFGSLMKPTYAQYEDQFIPHITVGRGISLQQIDKALEEIPEEIYCRGIVKKIRLIIVENALQELWLDEENHTVFCLDDLDV